MFRARIAAAIVRRGEIISIGVNKDKSHPFQKRYAKHHEAIYVHAEIDAIYSALRRVRPEELKRCSLLISRVKCSSKSPSILVPGLAKPCPGCARASLAFGIDEVYYTTEEGYEKL